MNYVKIAANAEAALLAAGVPAVLRQITRGAYNPATSQATTTTTDTPIIAAFLNYKDGPSGIQDEDGKRTCDVKVLIGASTCKVTPVSGDLLLHPDGTLYRVVKTKVTAPAGVPVLYECRARL